MTRMVAAAGLIPMVATFGGACPRHRESYAAVAVADTTAVRGSLPQALAALVGGQQSGRPQRAEVRLIPGRGEWAAGALLSLQDLAPWAFGPAVEGQTNVTIEVGALFIGPAAAPWGEISSSDSAAVEIVFSTCTPSVPQPEMNWARSEIVMLFIRHASGFRYEQAVARRGLDGRCGEPGQ